MFSKMKMIHSFIEDLHALHLPMTSRVEGIGEYAFAQAHAHESVLCPNCGRRNPMVAKDFAQFNFPYISPAIKSILLFHSKNQGFSFPEIHYEATAYSGVNSNPLPALFSYLQYNHQNTIIRPKNLETYQHYIYVFSKSSFYDPAFINAIYVKSSYFKPDGMMLIHPEVSKALNAYYCHECRDDVLLTLSHPALKDLLTVKKYGMSFRSSIFKETVHNQDPTLLKQLYSLMAVAMAFSLSFGRNIRVLPTHEMEEIESYLRFHKTIRPVTTL